MLQCCCRKYIYIQLTMASCIKRTSTSWRSAVHLQSPCSHWPLQWHHHQGTFTKQVLCLLSGQSALILLVATGHNSDTITRALSTSVTCWPLVWAVTVNSPCSHGQLTAAPSQSVYHLPVVSTISIQSPWGLWPLKWHSPGHCHNAQVLGHWCWWSELNLLAATEHCSGTIFRAPSLGLTLQMPSAMTQG